MPAVVKAPITWSPPQVGTLKLNSDASVRHGSQRCGEGLLLAKELKLKISCVELDACNIVAMVSSGVAIPGASEFVCADVMVLFKVVEVLSYQSISRTGNRVAHNLATLAMSSMEDFLWQNVCLSSIFPCLVV
ncbi:hypothetical protein Dsin_004850 [Dipteronia sinensis]|uniref:RNase H type-1 domain-containing protein n=1 Tax=Dipteronia sinensis TaxID=43782 RepID=A0AAE0AW58_9ROSI|nr:hypothetical protein Dsin_004850 [Dipteronia sinensis]